MLNIKHDQLTATINPLGAELSSLQSRAEEYLWQGDPTIWSGRAPILFPIVGTLINDEMSYRGKTYRMPRHGFVRSAWFTCIDQTESKLSMRFQSDVQSLQQYPWNFELTVHFSLNTDTLSITYEVLNRDTDSMIFTIGSHPAFTLPTTESTTESTTELMLNNLSINDFDIEFDQQETLQQILLDDAGLLETDSSAFELQDDAIRLSETIFQQDALIFKNIASRKIALRCKQKPRLIVDTGGAPHLGIWAKPGARYVCIEPWFGTSDYSNSDGTFENKPDMLMLLPNETFSHTMSVTIA